MEAVAGVSGRLWCQHSKGGSGTFVHEARWIFQHWDEFERSRRGIFLRADCFDLLQIARIGRARCKDQKNVNRCGQLAQLPYLEWLATPSEVEHIETHVVVEEEAPRVVSARSFDDLPQYVSSRNVFGFDRDLRLNQEVIRHRTTAFNVDAACHRELALPLTERFFSGDWSDVQSNFRIQNRRLRAVGRAIPNGYERSVIQGEEFKLPGLLTLVVGFHDVIQNAKFIF